MIGAFSFLTIFGRGRTPSPRDQFWFPVVGAAIGASVGLVWWGASHFWPSGIAAGLALVADLVITGLLHMDGLADSADGLLPPMDRAKRLAVMKQPDIGAFGVTTLVAVLLLRLVGFGTNTLDGWHTVVALAGIWALSRGVMVIAMNALPYARSGGGLADALAGRPSMTRLLVLLVLTVGIADVALVVGAGGSRGFATLAAGVVGAILVFALAHRRIGGYTGDVLGAAGVIVETFALLVLVARGT